MSAEAETQPPTDCDGKPLAIGSRVELVDWHGRPEGPTGVVACFNYPYWRGGWSICVNVEGQCPSNRGAHQVRVINGASLSRSVFDRLRGQ